MEIVKFIFKIFLLFLLLVSKEGVYDAFRLPDLFYSPVIKSMHQFLLFWLSINLIVRFNQFVYRKRKKLGHKYSDNVIVGLQNIYYLLTTLAIIVMIVGFFGIEFSKFLTALSIVAAAIAIISKDLVSDILTGILLSFSKDIALGDYVRIGDYKGRVMDINIYKIILHNEDDDIIYIPNSKAYFSDIVNYTQKEIRKYNVEFSIPTDNDVTLDELKRTMDKTFVDYKNYLDPNSEKLKITAINKDDFRYKIQFKLNQVNPKIAEEIKSRILTEILKKIQLMS
ncbi:MAG: mechanosensitive ion channel [Saprospiraceae bacterium]|jgi:small-conductance mechanosensitive channel|nr:mechanosensitive ion channel [Candidatus Vicinibacter proximus]MBL7824246.1 mechanosensitive ion channel [Saprospiraceae bacterium]HRG31769.1 mechanosensitive ion channel [Saprospiraceae bacterium]